MRSQLDTKTPGKYFLIPVLYVLMILMMLYLQFGKSIPFHDTYKKLEIFGKKSAASNDRGLSEIRLEYGEFAVIVSPSQRLVLKNESGAKEIALTGYAKYPDRMEVRFSDGFMLVFISNADSGKMEVYCENEGRMPEEILIPFQLRNPDEIRLVGGFPVLQHTSKSSGEGYFVRLPSGSKIDNTLGLLSVHPTRERKLITIESGTEKSIIAYWFSSQPVSINETQYDRKIAAYIDRSYAGWKTERYDKQSGTWKGNTANMFSDNLINAFGSEAFVRGEGFTFISRFIPSLQGREDATYLSNPYLGNIIDTSASLRNDAARAVELSQSGKITSLDDVFLLLRLKEILPESGIQTLQTKLEKTAEDRELENPSLYSAILLLYSSLYDTAPEQILRCVEEELLPRLTPYKSGYIFESREGVSDSFLGILSGLALINVSGNDLYRKIGRSAVCTYIDMADKSGRIPRELIRDDSDWTTSPEFLFPEEIYGLLTDNPFYPRATVLEAGMWSWTSAKAIEAVARGNQIVISSTFPIDGIYHICISGVRPFTSLNLYGIPWKSDPQFQYYSSGWAYNPDSAMLFIKIKQKRPVETIVIDYTPVAPAPEQEGPPVQPRFEY